MTNRSRFSLFSDRFDGLSRFRRQRDRVTPLLLAAGLALAWQPAAATAQAPDPGSYSPAVHEVIEERGHLVPMRDGVRLSTDIYFPDGDGPFPAILTITPYDNNGPRDRARWFARRGYVVVLADSRGRYDSGGEWDPFIVEHKTDGYDLVEWIGAQAWSNGNVGMIGGSYLGWTQWWTASQAPPSLKAIAPEVAPPDPFHNIPYQQGIMLGPFVDWAAWMSGRTAQVKEEGPYGGFTNSRWEDLLHAPYLTIDDARGMQDGGWWKSWINGYLASDPYWDGMEYQSPESFSRMTVPTLNMTGWFDADFPGSPINYLGMKAHGATPESRRPSLIIGPWFHGLNDRVVGGIDYGPEARIDLDGYITRWYDHHLKGIDNGVENDPPVYVFVMGPNRWYTAADWPLPGTEWTDLYLTSGGGANTSRGDGILEWDMPAADGSDTYVYDPNDPTPSPYGDHGHIPGAVEAGQPALRDDVLVYQTPVFQEPMEVTGPIEAVLYASTSARDTDWMVRLVDVGPDGSAMLLAEAILRARHRDPDNEGRFNANRLSEIEPGRVYRYQMEFWRVTGNVFGPGHRIRVEVSSSYYPFYLRNLNSGRDNAGLATPDEIVVATQTIHHGPTYPSKVVLPVIRRP